jgi:hypothetical protein
VLATKSLTEKSKTVAVPVVVNEVAEPTLAVPAGRPETPRLIPRPPLTHHNNHHSRCSNNYNSNNIGIITTIITQSTYSVVVRISQLVISI